MWQPSTVPALWKLIPPPCNMEISTRSWHTCSYHMHLLYHATANFLVFPTLLPISKLKSMQLLSTIVVDGQHHSWAIFWGWELGVKPITFKFELGLDFLTMHLPTKFHHPMCNRSEIIVFDKHPPHSTTLCQWKKSAAFTAEKRNIFLLWLWTMT